MKLLSFLVFLNENKLKIRFFKSKYLKLDLTTRNSINLLKWKAPARTNSASFTYVFLKKTRHDSLGFFMSQAHKLGNVGP